MIFTMRYPHFQLADYLLSLLLVLLLVPSLLTGPAHASPLGDSERRGSVGCGASCAQSSEMSRCLRIACRRIAMGPLIRFGKRDRGDAKSKRHKKRLSTSLSSLLLSEALDNDDLSSQPEQRKEYQEFTDQQIGLWGESPLQTKLRLQTNKNLLALNDGSAEDSAVKSSRFETLPMFDSRQTYEWYQKKLTEPRSTLPRGHNKNGLNDHAIRDLVHRLMNKIQRGEHKEEKYQSGLMRDKTSVMGVDPYEQFLLTLLPSLKSPSFSKEQGLQDLLMPTQLKLENKQPSWHSSPTVPTSTDFLTWPPVYQDHLRRQEKRQLTSSEKLRRLALLEKQRRQGDLMKLMIRFG